MKTQTATISLSGSSIRAILPHSYPMLHVDKVEYIDLEKQEISAIKYISQNEPCLQGHFADEAIFPAVYTIEALAQTAGLLLLAILAKKDKGSDIIEADLLEFSQDKQLLLIESKIRNTAMILPGHSIQLQATFGRQKLNAFEISVIALLDGRVASKGSIMLGSR